MSANDTSHKDESIIQTPMQLALVMALSFLVPVFGILMLVQLALGGIKTDPEANGAEAVVERIKPVARMTVSAGGTDGPAKTGEQIYQTVCTACHSTGAANAPKMGDANAWRKLIAEGQKTLVKDGIKGLRAMPPRGGSADLSDYEFERAVVYMANKSGGSFKEPAAPKTTAANK
ncbi:MAG: cytochrome c5 family protein [Betaproteobacteria bacterium]|nr:cytochrome c5 family protein [Betaproteobacteria bacterium]